MEAKKFTYPQLRDWLQSQPETGIILRGCPGAGKSTLIQKIKEAVPKRYCTVSSADFYRTDNSGNYIFRPEDNETVHSRCLRDFISCASAHLQMRPHFLISDNTNIEIHEFVPYVAIAKAYGYKPVIITLLTPPEIAAPRNRHGVPEKRVMEKWARLLYVNKQIPGHFNHIFIENH